MINHARTLLANLSPNTGVDAVPGEELIDPNFSPLELTSALRAARAVLFGTNPDRAGINYRLRQYMTVLHNTELLEFVLQLDPRITYQVNSPSLVEIPAHVITQYTGEPVTAALQGSKQVASMDNKLIQKWRVQQTGSTTVDVKRTTPPGPVEEQTFTSTGSLSSNIALPGSSVTFRFYTGASASDYPAWTIQENKTPLMSLGEVVESTYLIEETNIINLFGSTRTEPRKTFYNLWKDNKELPYRLGGFLLAYIWSAEALREG